MTTAAIRAKLHQYIDVTDDEHIKDLLHFVENSQNGQYNCSPEELIELHHRAEKVTNGDAIMYTAEAAHEYIRDDRRRK
jgi:hypothetical protein